MKKLLCPSSIAHAEYSSQTSNIALLIIPHGCSEVRLSCVGKLFNCIDFWLVV